MFIDFYFNNDNIRCELHILNVQTIINSFLQCIKKVKNTLKIFIVTVNIKKLIIQKITFKILTFHFFNL